MCKQFLLASALGLFLSTACAQSPPIGIDEAEETHFRQVALIVDGKAKSMDDSVLAKMWLDCYELRDIDSARHISSSSSLAKRSFWRDVFALLAGLPVNRERVLAGLGQETKMSSDVSMVLFRLFPINQLKANPSTASLAESACFGEESRVTEASGKALLSRANKAYFSGRDAEAFALYSALEKQHPSVKSNVYYARCAFGACYYEKGEELYGLAKKDMESVPQGQRTPINGALDFAYLAYYARKPLSLNDQGKVVADSLLLDLLTSDGALGKMLKVQRAMGTLLPNTDRRNK